MASSILLSDNGASSGSAGLKSTAGNDGTLLLQTTTSGGTATTAVTIGTDQSVTFAQDANLPNTFGFKNRIINGAMVIDQRNAGASVLFDTTTYILDRWRVAGTSGFVGAGSFSQSSVAPVGFKNSMSWTTSSVVSPSSSDFLINGQYIEGYNVADLDYGTSSAKTTTLSFWVRSSLTGTFGGQFENIGTNRIYVFSYTISTANTWEHKTVTVPGDTTGTWNTTNGIGLTVRFCLGSGSTYLGTPGSWGSTRYFGPTGQVNIGSTSGATFYITGVQLEKGSTATSFDFRSYGTELALCQRYYQQYVTSDLPLNGIGTAAMCILPLGISMRTAPTATYSNGFASGVSATNWTSGYRTASAGVFATTATLSAEL